MKGFLEIETVANVTGFSVDEIRFFVETRQIPHNSWPDGRVLFSAVDIEAWRRTHKPQLKKPPTPPAEAWTKEEPAAQPAAPAAPAEKPKATKAPARASMNPRGAKK